MKTLSIIIPAYNEERTVAAAVKKVYSAETPGYIKEIIVVNDGSTDETLNILRSLTIKIPFTLLSHSKNKGKGAAVRTGVKRAHGTAILIQDADLELTPDDYIFLLQAFSQGAEQIYPSIKGSAISSLTTSSA